MSTAVRLIAYFIPGIVSLAIAVIPEKTWMVNLATDDALYYPVVARNIAKGLGSTFDGVTTTNGYHPLWCWLQAPVAALFSGSPIMTYLWMIKLLMVVVVLVALVVWVKILSQICDSNWMTSTFVLLLGASWWSIRTMYGGMETPLVVLCIGICLLLADKFLQERTQFLAMTLGTALAACFLARLDTIFFVAVLAIVVFIKLGTNVRLQASWILPAVLLPSPYLVWNWTNFGNPVPVSGIRKTVTDPDVARQTRTIVHFVFDKLNKLTDVFHPAGIAALIFGASALVWLARTELFANAKRMGILWTVPPAAAIHFAYIALFMTEADVTWYLYLEYLSAFLIASLLVWSSAARLSRNRVGYKLSWAPFAMVCILVTGVLAGYAPRKLPIPIAVATYDTAAWARDHLHDEEPRFGMYDPGIFRAVSGFDTVALNGLAGDRTTLRLAEEANRIGFIKQYKLDYIVQFYLDSKISAIPTQYIRFSSAPFDHHIRGRGRFLILDSELWLNASPGSPVPPWK